MFGDGAPVDSYLTGLCERANDQKPHLDRALVAKQSGCENRTVFGKCERQGIGILEAGEAVTICDHLGMFLGRKPECQATAKANLMSLNLLIKLLCTCAVQFREIPIQHDLLAADLEYSPRDILGAHKVK